MKRLEGVDLLKRHEGFSATVYDCPAGKKTIGYGYNLEANPLQLNQMVIDGFCKNGISSIEAEQMLIKELIRLEFSLAGKLNWWPKINGARQAVLLNMAYNMGIKGLLGFTNTLTCIQGGDYAQAAKAMLDSTWAKQVHWRAIELALVMRTGELR